MQRIRRRPVALRPCVKAAAFAAYTVPLMPLQALLRRFAPRLAARFPRLYHRGVCRLLGIRLHVHGRPLDDEPCLIVANHCSWLDIPVMSAVKPLSFISKQEVGEWFFFGTLARLQRTLFVDRERRLATAGYKHEMERRLAAGDTLVLFAEGTSSDGARVLAFKSALMGAAEAQVAAPGGGTRPVSVQPVTLVYTRCHGLPLGRRKRPLFAWYGDMKILPHIWGALAAGPCDVDLHFHEPVRLDAFPDRKALARHCEEAVRAGMRASLRGRPDGAAAVSGAIRHAPPADPPAELAAE